jgi:hypothetical protein
MTESEMVLRDADKRTEIGTLIQTSIEHGHNPAEAWATYKEMVLFHARQKYFEAVASFRAECPLIPTDATANVVSRSKGTKFSYSYAPQDTMAKIVNPLCAKYGLSYDFDTIKADKDGLQLAIVIQHVGGHREVKHGPVIPVATEAGMSDQQKVSNAVSIAMRNTLRIGFGLTTTDEVAGPVAEPPDVSPISDKQWSVVRELIAKTGTDMDKFLKWLDTKFKTKTLETIRQCDYADIVAALEAKERNKQ